MRGSASPSRSLHGAGGSVVGLPANTFATRLVRHCGGAARAAFGRAINVHAATRHVIARRRGANACARRLIGATRATSAPRPGELDGMLARTGDPGRRIAAFDGMLAPSRARKPVAAFGCYGRTAPPVAEEKSVRSPFGWRPTVLCANRLQKR